MELNVMGGFHGPGLSGSQGVQAPAGPAALLSGVWPASLLA